MVRRPLGWELTAPEALRLVRGDSHPAALFGGWAGGRDVVASEPALVRSAPTGSTATASLDEVLDGWPAGPGLAGDACFGGGWIGYLGYSAGGEALPAAGPRRLPAWWFGWYDHVLVREAGTGRWFFEALWTDARAAALERRFADLTDRATRPAPPRPYTFSPFRLAPGESGHQQAVARTVEYIRAGDIFQANICLRAESAFAGDPLDAFGRAAAELRPPYAAFIGISAVAGTGAGEVADGADGPAVARTAVASLSPELFVRRDGRTVISKPIKGTVGRGDDPAEAAAQRAELERSAKNRSENVMIVDLVRNDLSRVCAPGTVTVPGLLSVEPHPGVWHLVSTVEGTLGDGIGDGALIRAAFPPGSVTGAPKVRALEIIDELELAPREAYTGAIGYRSPVAGLELNVAIRTFEFAPGRAWLGAGGGIVADSDPAAEYRECLIKATPLLTALGARLAPDPASAPGPRADGAAARLHTDPPTPVGAPAGLDELAWLAPRPSAGVFSSLRVTDGQTQGVADHLARLASSVRDLYGKDLPASLEPDLAACLASAPTGRLRITVRPVGGPLKATIEVIPIPPATPSEITASGAVGAPTVPPTGSRSTTPTSPTGSPGSPNPVGSSGLTLAGSPGLTVAPGQADSPGPARPAATPAAITVRPVTVAGGIGGLKWRDRRLLAELVARSGAGDGRYLLITDETGEILETDRANVFAVIDGVLLTPPADGRLLPGTTRAAVLRAARAHRIKVGQKPLTLDDLADATEVFVTNAVVGVLPVTAADGLAAVWTRGPVIAALTAALAARPRDPATGPSAVPAATMAPSAPGVGPAPLTSADPLRVRGPRDRNRPGRVAHRPVSSGSVAPRPVTSASSGAGFAKRLTSSVATVTGGAHLGPARPLVVLIDNYDSFTWNLAHLLSGSGARVEVVRNDEVTAAEVAAVGPAGVVISPGPCAPAEAGISVEAVRRCAAAGIPLLGICLGHQAIAAAFGAAIVRAPRPVHGQAFEIAHDGRAVFAGLPSPFPATRYHSLIVDEGTLPPELMITARTGSLPMGVRHATAPIEGVQFHPESVLTAHGGLLMANFVQSTVRSI